MDRGAWWITVHGVERVGHEWAINSFTFKEFRKCSILIQDRAWEWLLTK